MQSKNNIVKKLTKLIKIAIGNTEDTRREPNISSYFKTKPDITPRKSDQFLSPWDPGFNLTYAINITPHLVPNNFYLHPSFRYYHDKMVKYSTNLEKLLKDSESRKDVFEKMYGFVITAGYFAEHSQGLKDKMYDSFKKDENIDDRLNFLRKLKNAYDEPATDFTVNAYYSGVRYYAYSALAQFIESYLKIRPTLRPDEREQIEKEIKVILLKNRMYHPRPLRGDLRYLPDFSVSKSYGPAQLQEFNKRLKAHAAAHRELYEVATKLDDLHRKKIFSRKETIPAGEISGRTEYKLYERYKELLNEINKLEEEMPVHDTHSYNPILPEMT
jgi:hypothetical protein